MESYRCNSAPTTRPNYPSSKFPSSCPSCHSTLPPLTASEFQQPPAPSSFITSIPQTWRLLFAGGFAGAVAKTVVAPLERCKIVYQVGSSLSATTIRSTLQNIYKQDGFFGLYRGNFAMVARIVPYAGVQFTTFDTLKRHFGNEKASGQRDPTWLHFILGSAAGATAVLTTYPLDLIRARLAVQIASHSQEGHYRGICHAIQTIYRNERGLFGLYRGIVPTMMGIVPYGGANFGFNELFKKTYLQVSGDSKLSTTAKLLCGGLAGAVGQTIVYPLDVARRLAQVEGFAAYHNACAPERRIQFKSTWQAMKAIVANQGVKGLFRGISVNYVRVIPMVSTSFFTFDLVKEWLQVK